MYIYIYIQRDQTSDCFFISAHVCKNVCVRVCVSVYICVCVFALV